MKTEAISLQQVVDRAIESNRNNGMCKTQDVLDTVLEVVDRDVWTYERVLAEYVKGRIIISFNMQEMYSLEKGLYVDPNSIKIPQDLLDIISHFDGRIIGNTRTKNAVKAIYDALPSEYNNNFRFDDDGNIFLQITKEQFLMMLENPVAEGTNNV